MRPSAVRRKAGNPSISLFFYHRRATLGLLRSTKTMTSEQSYVSFAIPTYYELDVVSALAQINESGRPNLALVYSCSQILQCESPALDGTFIEGAAVALKCPHCR
jgi:succinate dehydrogenase/fumarate reductase-like Fe-S protein